MVLPMDWDEEHYQGYYLPLALGERIQETVAQMSSMVSAHRDRGL